MSTSTDGADRGLDLPTDSHGFLSAVRPLLAPKEYHELELRVMKLPRETHEAKFLWSLLLDHSGLSLAQRSLLRVIVDLGGAGLVEWPIDTLVRRTGMARSTCSKKIVELGGMRWLAVERLVGERYRLWPTVPTEAAVGDALADAAHQEIMVTPHQEIMVTPHQESTATPTTKAGGQGDQGYEGDDVGHQQTPPSAPKTVDTTVFRAAMAAVEKYLPPIREFEIRAEIARLLGHAFGYQDPDEWAVLLMTAAASLGPNPNGRLIRAAVDKAAGLNRHDAHMLANPDPRAPREGSGAA